MEDEMRDLRKLIPLVALVATSASCAPTHAGPAAGPQSHENQAVVQVSNHNWADVVVYAVVSGARYRLGMLTTNQSGEFRLPPGVVSGSGEVRLLVDPIGSRDVYTTQPIHVRPGQWVDFKIENHLAISNWAVWNR
jgi:hypothetical protein